MNKKKVRKKSFISKAQKQTRLKQCKEYKKQGKKNWKNVIWTDEVTFEVGKDSRMIWVT